MSQQNMEIVRRAYDAYARGDLVATLADFAAEVRINDHDVPDAGEYRGWAGLLRWQADRQRRHKSWRWEPEDFIDIGNQVVAILRVRPAGGESDVDVERVDAAVWTLSGGKCVRLDYYGSREQALQAVGLEEG